MLVRPTSPLVSMDYSTILASLKSASAFELYRLRAAIDRVLEQTDWSDAVRSRLRIGQKVEYFDPRSNRCHPGLILELRRKEIVVFDSERNQRWLLPYAAINVEGSDVDIREQPARGIGRNEVAVGDLVGFLDRNQQQRSGRVIRLNDKTATLLCADQQWRVPYSLLHRVVDGSGSSGRALEIEYRRVQD